MLAAVGPQVPGVGVLISQLAQDAEQKPEHFPHARGGFTHVNSHLIHVLITSELLGVQLRHDKRRLVHFRGPCAAQDADPDADRGSFQVKPLKFRSDARIRCRVTRACGHQGFDTSATTRGTTIKPGCPHPGTSLARKFKPGEVVYR
jgi:hypothetical protein